jgi:ubiquinone/menaquinone biosynthesis C-methylase UbiE
MPVGTARILDARALASAHRRLAALLRPGLRVLDVGCGTGAITRGIAEAVAPGGSAVGVDIDAALVERARAAPGVPGLAFAVGDVHQLPFRAGFDVATAARVLQWLADPADALRGLATAVRAGGRVVVLDYDHEKIVWRPEPPRAMRVFYARFLAWRAQAGMDNAIADHLATMFTASGLEEVEQTPQHEVTTRGDADFETRLGIWAEVAATRGHQMVGEGAITEAERAAAEREYRQWIRDGAESQTLYLVAVEGVRPA